MTREQFMATLTPIQQAAFGEFLFQAFKRGTAYGLDGNYTGESQHDWQVECFLDQYGDHADAVSRKPKWITR